MLIVTSRNYANLLSPSALISPTNLLNVVQLDMVPFDLPIQKTPSIAPNMQ